MALVEWVDELGADSVWFSEHHGFEDGYLSQPLVYLAAVASRTTRVRIGTSILIAPLRHPQHIAEEAALVDVLSGGRLELGLGAGYSPGEFELFGADRQTRFTATEAAVAWIRRALHPAVCVPPPHQAEIPLWLGFRTARGAHRAGEMECGLLSLDRSLAVPYGEAFRRGGVRVPRMAGMLDIIVATDPPAAAHRILPHYQYQRATYRAAHRRAPSSIHGARDEPAVDVDALLDAQAPFLSVLSPDDAVRAIDDRTRGLPVEHVYLWSSIAGMPDDLVEEHLSLALGHVRPALRS